jgi:translocation and assembly module TamB
VSSVEESTGGRAEIGSFDFDPSALRVTIRDFVIHGREPAGSPALVRVGRIVAEFRLFTHLTKLLDVRYLGIDRPEINVQIMSDGQTNIPSPKEKKVSNESPLQTVVDLAAGRFEVNDGAIALESQRQPLNVQGENLRAQFVYDLVRRTYGGEISLQPAYVVAGHNTPVTFRVTLPVTIGSDRVDLHGASISTAASSLAIDASFANVSSPQFTARVNGSLAIADLKNAADLPLTVNTRGVPQKLDLHADLSASGGVIRVSAFNARLGDSTVEASGASDRAIAFRSTLDIGELGRLLEIKSVPAGHIDAAGNIRINTNLRDLYLTDFNLNAFGGRFSGSASVRDRRGYQIDGTLRNFDIATILRAVHEQIPYDGVLSGSLGAEGDIQSARELMARARLTVTPGKRGRPVSGSLSATWDGASGNLVFAKSFLALPHSRLDINGSINNALNVSLKSRDLSDFPGTSGLALHRGQADLSATIKGALTSPRIAGHLAVSRLAIEGREFDSVTADLTASGAGVSVLNGSLIRAPMRADFSASAGLAQWKPLPREPLEGHISIDQGDLADIVALAGLNPSGYSGALHARAEIAGTIGNPSGTVSAQTDNGSIDGEPFDEARVQVNLLDQLVTIPAAYIQAGAGRIDLNAEFRHPRDSFTSGHLHAAVRSSDIDLSRTTATGSRSNAAGSARIDADIAGDLNQNEFLPSTVTANVSTRALRFEGQYYGDAQGTARTNGQTVTWNFSSDFAGSSLAANGHTRLVRDYPTTADATIGNLAIEKALAAVRRTDIPARGILGGSLRFTGTVRDPQAEANLVLSRGAIDDEPIDELRLRASYLAQAIDVSQFRLASGLSRIELSAHYDHPADDLLSGNARFNIESSRIDLARIRNIQMRRPGLAGTLQLSAHGDGAIVRGDPHVQLRDLAANVSATGIAVQGRTYGDLKFTIASASGNKIEFALDSNLAGASIQGRGSGALTAGYPVDAQISFNKVLYSHFANLLGKSDESHRSAEIAADGQVTVNGPLLDQNQLRANLRLTRLSLTADQGAAGKPVTVENQGPVTVALEQGRIRIQNAHIAGAGTDLQASGSASLTARTLDLTVKGKANLDVLPKFDRDIYSSGQIDLAAAVRGTVSRPLVNGQLTLQNASLNYAGLPAGLSKANGQIVFDGNGATVRNLSADAGGGRLTLSGFAGYSDRIRFALQAKATSVRMRVQEGISVTASTNLQLTGSDAGSVVSGTAIVDQVSYNPRTDIGAVLSRATPVVQSASDDSPLLEKMKLDIRVRAASGLSVQAEMAENLSATIDLHVQGTAAQPGLLGRITINDGQLVFFGATYTVDTGVIAFYTPSKIEPTVDLSLETQAQGVDVTVRIRGLMNDLKLSYTSNPPLQFQEIVGLLAAGKTPTSDPTLLANQPDTPAASVQQMGESAILGQAVANPVAGRLQRVFGVSQLNLAPTFQSGSQTPTARLTLQQRVTNNLTFTYTSALDDPNGEIVSVQWTFDPKWSAVATRDQNGIFSINFFYKRQFR